MVIVNREASINFPPRNTKKNINKIVEDKMASMRLNRMRKELQMLQQSPPIGICAYPVDDKDMNLLEARMFRNALIIVIITHKFYNRDTRST
jgi:hypothetical protein